MWVVIGIVVFGLLAVVVMYNSLVSKKNQAENAFASMDVPDVKMVLTQYPSATARLTARSGEVTTLSL